MEGRKGLWWNELNMSQAALHSVGRHVTFFGILEL